MQNQELNEGVQDQLATDEKLHQSEVNQESQGNEKPKTAEYNFREMRRTVDELKNHLELEKREKEEIKKQLDTFKSGFKKVFEPEQNEDSSGDELMTVAEFEKRLQKQKLQQEIEDVPKAYPDYYDVVKFVEPLVKENPALLDAIQNSRNPRLAAYQLVKNSYAYKSATQKADSKEIEKNLSKPIPSESISGGSGIDASPRSMSLAEKAEVWKMARMYARGA
ncbi:hypothetical protein EBR77_04370 [bacterium]|nr:hypothetical protein [bacterium]